MRNFKENFFYGTPLDDCFCALWRLVTGNSYRNSSKAFGSGKLTVVSIIIYRSISSNFQEPQVEQPKQLLPLTRKLLGLLVQFGLLELIAGFCTWFSNHSLKKEAGMKFRMNIWIHIWYLLKVFLSNYLYS